MAKLRRNEYWAWIDETGNFVLDFDDSPVIRKTRTDVINVVRDTHDAHMDEEIKQMIYNGQTCGAFPRITKIKLTYQVI